MDLAVFGVALQDVDRLGLLRWLADHAVPALELGCGAYPGKAHADAQVLAAQPTARAELQAQLRDHGVRLAALSVHGNPLHPDAAIAQAHRDDLHAAIDAAAALEVPVVVAFSGQPGTGGHLNWPLLPWPAEYAALREQQWAEQIVPLWRPLAAAAQARGVRVALELHGGFAVHSPGTLLRLREACGAAGEALAANLDPSHLWWQGIDPVQAVGLLGALVAHVHLKDLVVNPAQLVRHGWLDPTPHERPHERAWHFGVPGQGHDAATWQALCDALAAVGYRGVLSVEHEAPMPAREGIGQALAFMRALPRHHAGHGT